MQELIRHPRPRQEIKNMKQFNSDGAIDAMAADYKNWATRSTRSQVRKNHRTDVHPQQWNSLLVVPKRETQFKTIADDSNSASNAYSSRLTSHAGTSPVRRSWTNTVTSNS